VPRTPVAAGRRPGRGTARPARIERAEPGRIQLRQRQLAQERRFTEAAARLAETPIGAQPLDQAQTDVLLRLLDIALAGRVATATTTGGTRLVPLVAAAHGVRLTLTPDPGRFTTVPTVGGALHLDGFRLSVTRVDDVPARHRELASV
jgi:hypothetical protein